ncbi:hypothetical protein CPB86DRAFT_769797 [Serendipita vermifera]|nr:hypothetical protein CPB86DRAFT_769797 [Serendipita vermifera]
MPNLISYTLWENHDQTDSLSRELPNINRGFTANVQPLSLDVAAAQVVGADESEFTQLRTLTWLIHWNSAYAEYRVLHRSYPSLTKISFEGDTGYKGAVHFSELLLRYPRTCPRLETIRICGYPNWSIFLYMLFRRNVETSRKDISAITTIEVPGYPAPFILVPLSALLQRKIPLEMPSLEEHLYDDIFYNPAIPGCFDCIVCGLTCSTPVTSIVPKEFQGTMEKGIEHIRDNKFVGSDPPLPDYIQDCLDSYLERWSGWLEKQKQNGFKGIAQRAHHCERHNYKRLLDVDGHILDGVELDSKELEYPVSQTDDASDW